MSGRTILTVTLEAGDLPRRARVFVDGVVAYDGGSLTRANQVYARWAAKQAAQISALARTKKKQAKEKP